MDRHPAQVVMECPAIRSCKYQTLIISSSKIEARTDGADWCSTPWEAAQRAGKCCAQGGADREVVKVGTQLTCNEDVGERGGSRCRFRWLPSSEAIGCGRLRGERGDWREFHLCGLWLCAPSPPSPPALLTLSCYGVSRCGDMGLLQLPRGRAVADDLSLDALLAGPRHWL